MRTKYNVVRIEEASKRFCPLHLLHPCEGERCMMWTWFYPDLPTDEEPTEGYCRLGGVFLT